MDTHYTNIKNSDSNPQPNFLKLKESSFLDSPLTTLKKKSGDFRYPVE